VPVERIRVRTEAFEVDVLIETATADFGPERIFERAGPDDVPEEVRSPLLMDEAVDRFDQKDVPFLLRQPGDRQEMKPPRIEVGIGLAGPSFRLLQIDEVVMDLDPLRRDADVADQ